jgi:hypothetical protein
MTAESVLLIGFALDEKRVASTIFSKPQFNLVADRFFFSAQMKIDDENIDIIGTRSVRRVSVDACRSTSFN